MMTEEASHLQGLEESLWRSETRFNPDFIERTLADEFFEIGRSGRVYQRQDTLDIPSQPVIDAKLPFADFNVQFISAEVVLITYVSIV